MSDLTSSSPFIDRPKGSLNDDTEFNLKQSISNLQYQLNAIKTEKSMMQETQQSLIAKYEMLLSEKNDKIKKLENDFEFLYKERNELNSKSSNSNQIMEEKIKSLEKANDKLQQDYEELDGNLKEADDKLIRLNTRLEQAKSQSQYDKQANQQLEDHINRLENDNNQLLKNNDELIKKLEQITKSSTTNDMLKFNETLGMKNLSLQKINNQLQLKIDKLLQNKTSTELLKQKNLSLLNKLTDYETLKENCAKLEIKNMSLEAKFTEFLKILKKSNNTTSTDDNINENTLVNFLNNYNHLKNMNAVLEEKLNQAKDENETLKATIIELEHQIEHQLTPLVNQTKEQLTINENENEKLQHQLNLNTKEIQHLRGVIQKLESFNAESQKEAVSKSTDEYLTTLEKLVDDYKKEIADLKESAQANAFKFTNKRPKVDDEYRRRSQIENSAIQKENIQLSSEIEDLKNRNDVLQTKLNNLSAIEVKKKELHVLQLKANPFTKHQIVQQTTLNALQKENSQLIDKFIKHKPTIDVPQAVYETQELEIAKLQDKVMELQKKNQRLTSTFTKRARDVLITISKFFGFSIEFLDDAINANELSPKIKLVSKYTNTPDLENSYLILDMTSKSLKAHGNYEFTKLCEVLMSEWSNNKDQISCILSALNIKLYERYYNKININ